MSAHEPATHAEFDGDSATGEHTEDTEDEVKRRFREALERKHARGRAGAAHEDAQPGGKAAHGPAGHKRTFRRKTG